MVAGEAMDNIGEPGFGVDVVDTRNRPRSSPGDS
jgi:hypothetical protein